MTYRDYMKQHSDRFNALPIFWAFSRDQFEKAMQERGLTANDTDQVYSFGLGVYYLRKDAGAIREYSETPDELPELMKDYDFAFSAIYYEMGNHEYHINGEGDWDVLNCFGYIPADEADDDLNNYFDMVGFGETTRKAYMDARRKFLHDADENDWY